MNYKLPIIEKYIIKNYPNVSEVTFRTKEVYLGSSPELDDEERTIEQTVIQVTIDNTRKKLTKYQVSELRKRIFNEVSESLGIDYISYGAKWDIDFFVNVNLPYWRYQNVSEVQ